MRLYWKGRRLPAYRHRIGERFMWHRPQKTVDIWIHAVSLGEVVAVSPLIEQWLDNGYAVMVTTMTPTGSSAVTQRFGSRVSHQYLPYDMPFIVRRFYRSIQPKVGIIMETELWPNLICEAKRFDIPLLLVNARLSDSAYHQYLKVQWFFAPILQHFVAILAQSEEDAARFRALGADIETVLALGNMKFDQAFSPSNHNIATQLKKNWGQDRPVLIAASTHDDEEAQMLNALHEFKKLIPGLLLIIAPRHPERFREVYDLSQESFNTGLRSQPQTIHPSIDVMILDTLGELMAFYQISDVAFVGGSLTPVGGHNVLEPIAMGVPVLTGPYMHNSKAICRDLKEAQALCMVHDVEEFVKKVVELYQDQSLRQKQIRNALNVLNANRGSIQRYFTKIEEVMRKR